jgi:hypothetical protein
MIKRLDKTDMILYQLDNMLAEGDIKGGLKGKVEQLIDGVREGRINLNDYRKADAKERYGKDLIEAIIAANMEAERLK